MDDVQGTRAGLEGGAASRWPGPGSAGGRTLKVLHIVGFGRSGSTILGNLLGGMEGVFHLGEIHRLWSRMRSPGPRVKCGCLEDLQDCPFWGEALARTAARMEVLEGGPSGAAAEGAQPPGSGTLDALMPHIPQELLHARSLRRHAPSAGYARMMAALFHSVADMTGARVLVDSSKAPVLAGYTRDLPTIVPYVLHIVRDPRGAVFSRQRRKAPFIGDRIQLRPLTAAADSLRWIRANLAAHAVCRSTRDRRHILLSYEEFVTHPEGTLRRVAKLIGEEPAALPLLDDHSALLGTNHTVAGNRNRFARGEVELRLDDRWVRSLGTAGHLLITSLTLPLLLRYGYPLRRPGRASKGRAMKDNMA